jgi:hypothetical protein
MKIIRLFACILISMMGCTSNAPQVPMSWPELPDTALLQDAYVQFRDERLDFRRFKHADYLQILLEKKAHPQWNIEEIGASALGKSVYQVDFGHGDISVMMWSQMHGNEPTATLSLLDLMRFLEGEDDAFAEVRQLLKERITIHMIPMLNPDGADIYTRRNAQGIDVNRDARALATPEAKILRAAQERNKPDFAFNLHDQHVYYRVPGTQNPVSIALLAPAYNDAREVNEVRLRAMQLAAGMQQIVHALAPDAVAKYDDTHSPRGFGDHFQRSGTSTVLVESGAMRGDPEKQEIRRLHFALLLQALIDIAQQRYTQFEREHYEQIPFNQDDMCDLLLQNVRMDKGPAGTLPVDMAIKREEITVDRSYFHWSRIEDIGDLKDIYVGYESFDASGYEVVLGQEYPHAIQQIADMTPEKAYALLQMGYMSVKIERQPENPCYTHPIFIYSSRKPRLASPSLETEANFYLAKNGKLHYAVLNGAIIDLHSSKVPELKMGVR